jgi:hypothetical protein
MKITLQSRIQSFRKETGIPGFNPKKADMS